MAQDVCKGASLPSAVKEHIHARVSTAAVDLHTDSGGQAACRHALGAAQAHLKRGPAPSRHRRGRRAGFRPRTCRCRRGRRPLEEAAAAPPPEEPPRQLPRPPPLLSPRPEPAPAGAGISVTEDLRRWSVCPGITPTTSEGVQASKAPILRQSDAVSRPCMEPWAVPRRRRTGQSRDEGARPPIR